MTIVFHIFDESRDWEQRLALGQLLDRMPSDRFTLRPFALGESAIRLDGQIQRLRVPFGISTLRGVALHRAMRRENPAGEGASKSLIHTWGPRAAAAAATCGLPMVVSVQDPATAKRNAKLLRTLADDVPTAMACTAELTRRRLVENGVPPEQCVVIRPGVDFRRLNQLRRRDLRSELGIAREHTVIIVPPGSDHDDGMFEAFWAGTLLNHLDGGVRVVIPGDSRGRRRIARFAATLPTENALVCPPDDLSFEELLIHANVMIAAGIEENSTTAIAWAMAAGVPVIASATYAHTELIAHKVGGLLFKPPEEGGSASAIARLLRDKESLAKAKEVASGQAYEVFGLRRFAEQHAKLYGNLSAGIAAGEGIEDPARANA